MTWEKGILTDIEDAAIAVLIALNDDNGDPLFKNISQAESVNSQTAGAEKCVNHWLGQIGIADGGIASFGRYSPFAFVRTSLLRTEREGGYDANVRISLDIAVGQQSEFGGIARIGDATHVGINRIFEKVFLAIDNWHPGSGIACDPFYLTDTVENVMTDKQAGLQLHFEAAWIPLNS